MAKLKATEMLVTVVDKALQIHGGLGLMSDLPLERIWRDARIERIWVARQLLAEGLINQPVRCQWCLGIKYGAPASADAMRAMRDALPRGCLWSAFGLGRMQMPMVAQAVLLGGNVRVGLEDNLYLEKGIPATNAQLVEPARALIELLGVRVLTATETRGQLGFAPAICG